MKRRKTGGRRAGVPNQITKDIREHLNTILMEEIGNIPDLLNQIEDPEKKLLVLIKLLPFVAPKLKDTSLNIGGAFEEQPLFQITGMVIK
jgi:hypothetical protein